MRLFAALDTSVEPFEDGGRLYNVVTVRFPLSFIRYEYDARQLQLEPDDQVIVETERGHVLAEVVDYVRREVREKSSLQRIDRKATEQDLQQAARLQESERDAYRFVIERVRARNLPMKIVRAHWMHDNSRIVFYFSAEGRIDFRDLVKDLAHRFRTRIEMHQIGVRDGTRMLGGIGPCGRELCCSTFLENFAPVSIRMAKDQGLSINPKKVSGMCGRLMCCLVYEQQLYRRMRKRLPRAGTEVFTSTSPAKVLQVDVINEKFLVEFQDGTRKTLSRDEVSVKDPEALLADAEPDDEDYEWDDILPAGSAGNESDASKSEAVSKPRRKRSRRRRRRKNKEDS